MIPDECLDFEAWKAQQAVDCGDPDFAYDPSTEDLPDHVWYALDDQTLHQKLVKMCDDLGQPVFNCNVDDPEITELIRALGRVKKIPRAKNVNIAVVGNQDVGKSSTINALLNRELEHVHSFCNHHRIQGWSRGQYGFERSQSDLPGVP